MEVLPRDLSALAQDWPQWRGPQGNGVAPDQDLPTQWEPSTDFVWTADLPGQGHGSPIVVGEAVVVAAAMEADEEIRMLAYDRQTGRPLWNTLIHQGGFPERKEIHPKATYANSTVASDGERFYVTAFIDSRIYVTAIDLTGERVWQVEIGRFVSRFGYAPSPVLYQSLILVAADNSGGGYLVGIDRESGKIAWRVSRGNSDSYSSPAIATINGRDELILTGGDQMIAYDPGTGDKRWQTPCISKATCGTAVVAGDRIFASGGYPEKETVCISNGQRIWSNRTKVYEPSLITDGTSVFAVTDDGIAYCCNARDGKERWKQRLGGKFSSSPVMCSGNLFVADLSGNCYVFAASQESYDQVAKNSLRDDCYASPAVSRGQLFFRVGIGSAQSRKEQLICIGKSAATAK